ncbi:MAG: YggT family protein [Candidatus Electrothrix gigas]
MQHSVNKKYYSLSHDTNMFILGNFLMALANLIHLVLSAYIWIVVGRAIISWVNPDPYNPIVRFLIQATDPLLEKIRRYIPPMGGLDLSPIILIFALVFLQSFIVNNLMDIGRRLL